MGLLIVSTLLKHVLMLANDLLIGHVSTSIARGIRMRVFDVAMHMDKKTFQTYGTSGLMAAITSAADGLAAGLMSLFGAAVREPLRVLSCLIMACFISWRLLLLSSILAPLLIVVVIYFNKKIRSIASSILIWAARVLCFCRMSVLRQLCAPLSPVAVVRTSWMKS